MRKTTRVVGRKRDWMRTRKVPSKYSSRSTSSTTRTSATWPVCRVTSRTFVLLSAALCNDPRRPALPCLPRTLHLHPARGRRNGIALRLISDMIRQEEWGHLMLMGYQGGQCAVGKKAHLESVSRDRREIRRGESSACITSRGDSRVDAESSGPTVRPGGCNEPPDILD